MSFQHFRLGQLALAQPLPPHLQQNQQPAYAQTHAGDISSIPAPTPTVTTTSATAAITSKSSATKAPYGSGDSDDGYTLVFPSLAAFHEWRMREEETQMVEFVKGDTHGSKAVPPRFKDHTKLVCARHSRSGRKKYVKKHPDRVRKVPSRKLEGQGCQASISYKTYFDTEEVRACYVSQHSHEIGIANLPYTRRGRRAVVQREKDQSKRHGGTEERANDEGSSPSSDAQAVTNQNVASSSIQQHASNMSSFAHAPLSQLPHPFPSYTTPSTSAAPTYPPLGHAQPATPGDQDRWDRMSVLFTSIRDHARTVEYPTPSVAALESILVRLYLESPMGVGVGLGVLGANMHGNSNS